MAWRSAKARPASPRGYNRQAFRNISGNFPEHSPFVLTIWLRVEPSDEAHYKMRKVQALSECMVRRATERGKKISLLPEKMQATVGTKQTRRAAVLIPVVSVGGVASVVLSVRSEHVSSHRNQVAFPGGHVEPGETSEAAAYREAVEELGDKFQNFRTVDTIADVLAPSGAVVTPVVATSFDDLNLNDLILSDEVSDVFALSIDHLLDPQNKEYKPHPFSNGVPMPVFHGGPRDIWGFSAFVLDGCLRELIHPCWPDSDDDDVLR